MAIVEKLFTAAPYNAPTDGTSNASPALALWLTDAAAIIAGGDTPKLRMQGHTYNFAGVPNGPSDGLSRAIIDGEGATVGEFWLGNAGVLRESFLYSARIGTVTAGATSATVIQGPYPNDVQISAAFLSVGQWILITGISMQAGGYPPNFQYNEFRKITGIVGNVVSWAEPLVYEYKQTWPLCDTTPVTVSASSPAVVTMAGHGFSAGRVITFSFDVGGALPTATPTPITRYAAYYVISAGLTANTFRFATTAEGTAINTSSTGSSVLLHTQTMDHGGPATIYGLMNHFEGEHQYSNITCAKTEEVFGGGTTSLILDNVDFTGDGPCPSMAKSWIHKNSVIGSQNEVDKCVEYCEYNNCTAVGLGQVMFFSPGCMETLITGCTFKTLNGAAHNLTIVDSNIYGAGYLEGFLAGCTAYGRTNTITIDGTTVNQGQIAGNVLDLATFAGWSFVGGTFSVPLTHNAAKNEALRCFVPGYKYIVGYGSGRNTNPETGSGPIIFTVASMYQDATHLHISTNLASATWPNYGGGFQPDSIFSYAARTVTQTSSGPFDVTTLAEPSRTFALHLVALVVPPLDDVEPEVVAGYSPGRSLLTSFGSGAKVTESGGVVQSWINQKSGGVAALSQSTVAYRPTIATAGPNSRQCLNFDGTDDCLFGSAISNYITAAAGLIVISFIADVIDASNITVYANEGLMGDSGGFMGLFTKTPDAVHFYNYDGTTDTVSTPITEGVPYVVEWRHEGGVGYVRINGGTEVSVASANTSGLTGLLGVGGTSVVPAAATSFDGKIFEMATFKTVPTLAKRNTLVADMMAYCGAV